MKKHKKFLLVGLFWLVIIIVFIGSKEFTLRTGREVLLETVPVDPRDLFRGDYVALNYKINTINTSTFGENVNNFYDGDNIFVALDPGSKCAVPIGIYQNEPNAGMFIKGKIRNTSGNNLIVQYGIENYFVPEGEGKEIERLRNNELVVKASVDNFGNAAIKELSIKGNECL